MESSDQVLQDAVNMLHKLGAGQIEASSFIKQCTVPVLKGVSVAKPSRKTPSQARADCFRLDPGRFLAQGGSKLEVLSLEVLSEISALAPPHVVLLDSDQAQGWLTTANLVKHELVMVVLGGCSGTNCKIIHIPAFNLQGEPVILRVCVHQLGSLKSKTLDNTTSPHCVIAFHMYLEDFQTDGWNRIRLAPVKEVALRFSEGSAMFISPPWSRQWLSERKNTAKEHATQVSLMARVCKRNVASLYRQSGHNSVFEDGNEKPDENCSVIWIGEDNQKVAFKREEQLGLVRSWRKGHGIRVLTSDFKAVFTEIRRQGFQSTAFFPCDDISGCA